MSPIITDPCDTLDELRLRMIRELEWFLSSTVQHPSGRVIPTSPNSHAQRRQNWYDTRANSAAGEKPSC